MRKNPLVFCLSLILNQSVPFSYMKSSIRLVKSKMPSTAANDNCQETSKSSVGFIIKRIIAASASELKGLLCRRKKNDKQKTRHIIAARNAGGFDGTTSTNIAAAIIQTTARARFIKPAVLHSHHIIPTRMPKFIPDRHTKCNSPVLRNASKVAMSISAL